MSVTAVEQVFDRLQRGFEPCRDLGEEGLVAYLLLHQPFKQGNTFRMAVHHLPVAAQRRVMQELRALQEGEAIVRLRGIHEVLSSLGKVLRERRA